MRKRKLIRKKAGYLWLQSLLLSLVPLLSQGQVDTSSVVVNKSKSLRPAYLEIAGGKQYSLFRDFATSPLFYSGNPTFVGLSHIDFDDKRESNFCLSYTFGTFRSTINSHRAENKVNLITLNYLELFQVSRASSSRINLKLGGQFTSTVIIRENEALGNNSEGYDIISTLFGSIKGSFDAGKRGKLSAGFNLGLVNSGYRNGFIYTRQSPVINQDKISDGYQFQLFSGYRLNSSIAYTFWLQNGNAVRLSYRWEAFKTGGNHDELELATHLLHLSLLFNLSHKQ